MEYSGAGGKLIHEKNQKQKISWHCPFKKQLDCATYSCFVQLQYKKKPEHFSVFPVIFRGFSLYLIIFEEQQGCKRRGDAQRPVFHVNEP